MRSAFVPAAALVALLGALAVRAEPAATEAGRFPGVADPQRAWQNWTLNCQGCHRVDGSGDAATAPSIAGTVALFLNVPGGREYLGQVPGVATSPLADADLAEVMNWMLWRFDASHIPKDFKPYTAEEVHVLRQKPLRLEANQRRTELLEAARRGTL